MLANHLEVYLELIQLTEIHLLKQLPTKSMKAPTPIPKREPKPIIKEKEIVAPLPPPPSPQVVEAPPTSNKDLGEVLSLIKTHCPKLVLLEKTLEESSIMLLFNPQTEGEKQLVSNLTAALKKEGYGIENELQNASLIIGERSSFLPIKEQVKRDAEGRLKIGNAKALVVQSLAELITYPEKRRSLWSEIQSLLKK